MLDEKINLLNNYSYFPQECVDRLPDIKSAFRVQFWKNSLSPILTNLFINNLEKP